MKLFKKDYYAKKFSKPSAFNEQLSWVFYRYAVGFGMILLGIAAVSIAIKVGDIANSARYFADVIEVAR